MIIKPSGEVIETDQKSIDELVALMEHLEEKCLDMDAQIAAAKAQAKVGAIPMEQEWYNKIRRALFLYRRDVQKLKTEIAARRKRERIANSKQVSDFFVELCRERMPEELFEALRAEAYRRLLAWQEEVVA